MRRLTISAHACTETLSLLIAMAWADGRLDDKEKAGVRGAAEVLNLSKEIRQKLDNLLEKPLPLDQILLDGFSGKDKSFAYVAASWMSGADEELDTKEKALLDMIVSKFGFDAARRTELDNIAKELLPPKGEKREWGDEITRLFKAIPPRLEQATGDVEVAFE